MQGGLIERAQPHDASECGDDLIEPAGHEVCEHRPRAVACPFVGRERSGSAAWCHQHAGLPRAPLSQRADHLRMSMRRRAATASDDGMFFENDTFFRSWGYSRDSRFIAIASGVFGFSTRFSWIE